MQACVSLIPVMKYARSTQLGEDGKDLAILRWGGLCASTCTDHHIHLVA